MSLNEKIFQVLDFELNLINWFIDEKDANEFASTNEEYMVIEGTDHIHPKCKCGSVFVTERFDAYGFSTGYWCDKCYNGNEYPYRKDKYYDPLNAGEHLYEEEY